jgi:hypothetical protein
LLTLYSLILSSQPVKKIKPAAKATAPIDETEEEPKATKKSPVKPVKAKVSPVKAKENGHSADVSMVDEEETTKAPVKKSPVKPAKLDTVRSCPSSP